MRVLAKHQIETIARGDIEKHVALLQEPGTRKTATTIHILKREYNRRQGLVNTLIFAPITVCAQWKVEFDRESKVPQDDILVLTGKGSERTALLQERLKKNKPCIVVTNWESVQIESFYKTLLKWSPDIVALDESHRLKDSQSKRAKKIYPLAHAADRRLILTGTYAPNTLMDIFGQYKALDPGVFGSGAWSFKTKYFYDKNAGKKFQYPEWVPHPWAEKEIAKLLAKNAVFALRKDCLDLPPLQAIPVTVPMGKAQEKAYKEMEKDFMTVVKDRVMSSEFEMTKSMRLRQILAGYVQPDGGGDPIWFEEQPRIAALLDKLDGIGDAKAILWTEFRPTYQKLGEALTKAGYKIAYLTGDQKTDTQKQEQKALFTQGDAQVLIANPAAASEGVDGLQIAQYAFYYMRGWNLLHFLQSLARNYRSGSEIFKSILHYHFYTPGTVEEVIAIALIRKEDIGKALYKWATEEQHNSLANVMGNEYPRD